MTPPAKPVAEGRHPYMIQSIEWYPLSSRTLCRDVKEAVVAAVPGWTPANGVSVIQTPEGLLYRFAARTDSERFEVHVPWADADPWAAVEHALLTAVARKAEGSIGARNMPDA